VVCAGPDRRGFDARRRRSDLDQVDWRLARLETVRASSSARRIGLLDARSAERSFAAHGAGFGRASRAAHDTRQPSPRAKGFTNGSGDTNRDVIGDTNRDPAAGQAGSGMETVGAPTDARPGIRRRSAEPSG
jgi:hypothetical protein